jgi:hypothetical protein
VGPDAAAPPLWWVTELPVALGERQVLGVALDHLGPCAGPQAAPGYGQHLRVGIDPGEAGLGLTGDKRLEQRPGSASHVEQRFTGLTSASSATAALNDRPKPRTSRAMSSTGVSTGKASAGVNVERRAARQGDGVGGQGFAFQ